MPQKLKSFEFKALPTVHTFPWDNLLDGTIWALKEGTDYTCRQGLFVSLARKVGKQRDLYVRFGKQDTKDGEVLVMQAVPATREQIQDWKDRAATRKAKIEAKKAERAAAKAAANGDEEEVDEDEE